MGNNDNRVVTHSALNSFITSNGGSPKNNNASSYAIPFGEFNQYAPMYDGTSAGVVISDYTGIGGGSYTSKQLVIEKDVTWRAADAPVIVDPTGITVSPKTNTINVGDTVQLTATVTPSNATDKSVTWSSSDTSIATVSNTGLVTGVAVGTVTITATTSNNLSDTATVTVVNPQYQGTAMVDLVGNYSYVTWGTNTTPTTTAGMTHFDSANQAGVGTLVTYNDVFSYTFGTDVNFYWIPEFGYAPTNIVIRSFDEGLPVAEDPWTEQLIASQSLGYSDLTFVGFTTDQHLPIYQFTLRIDLSQQPQGDCSVLIELYASETSIDVDDVEVAVGATEHMNYTFDDADDYQTQYDVTYMIDNTSIATVDQEGIVTGVTVGETTGTVISNITGAYGCCTVTVVEGSGGSGSGNTENPWIYFYGNGAYLNWAHDPTESTVNSSLMNNWDYNYS